MTSGEEVTATLTGDLDASVVWTLEKRLMAAVRAHPGSTLLVDASAVTFVDASCLGALIRLQRLARDHDVLLLVTRPSRSVRSLIERTRTEQLLAPSG